MGESESTILKAEQGVLTTKMFPARTWVGPYQGDPNTDHSTAEDSGYSWLVCACDSLSDFVDAQNYTAKWVKHINCTRSSSEQVVTAYQSLGDIYYRAHYELHASLPESIDKCLKLENQEDNSSLTETKVSNATTSNARETSCQHSDVFKPEKQLCTEPVFPCQLCQSDFVQFRSMKIPLSSNRWKKYRVRLAQQDTARCRPSDTDQEKAPVSHAKITGYSHIRGVATKQYVTVGEAPGSHMTFTGDRGVDTSQYVTVGEAPVSNMTFTGDRGVATKQYVTVGEAPVSHVTFTGDKGVATKQYVTVGEAPVSHVTFSGDRGVATKQYVTVGEAPISHVTFTGDRGVDTNQYLTLGEAPVCHVMFTGDRSVATNQYVSVGEAISEVQRGSLLDNGHEQYVNEAVSKTPDNHHNASKCKHCGKAHGCSNRLKMVQRNGTGEKPYQCLDCGKAFGQPHQLIGHERVHTGDKPFQCTVCGTCFKHKHHLKAHQRIHTTDKPFLCSDCGKAFRHSQSMKIHERIHTGEKPFQCTFCGKAYNRSQQLKTHQRIHTGENPTIKKSALTVSKKTSKDINVSITHDTVEALSVLVKP